MNPNALQVPGAGSPLQRRLPWILAGLSTLGPFAIDTYLPAFGAISADLQASEWQVQQSLTAYMLPFAIMALWHGAVSDALGRKRVVLTGLVVFALASIGAALSSSIGELWFWRAIQGAVGGTGMTVGRAVIRDVADGPMAQRMMSQVTMMFAIAPAIAPVLGGWLAVHFGWRAIFFFLAGVAALIALACWRWLPETRGREHRQPLEVGSMLAAYGRLFRHAGFLRIALTLGLNFAGFFVFVLAAPVYLPRVLGLQSTEFAWLFVPAVAGTMLGAFLSSRLAGRVSRLDCIRIGYVLMFAALAIHLAQAVFVQPLRVPWATLPLLVYNTGLALAMAPLQLMLLDLFGSRRGMASSGMAFTQSAGNALVAAIIAPLLWHSALGMGLGALTGLLVAVGLFTWHMRTPARD
ncbi:MAG: multidrug effflux MFS transporter [Burkholderiaceae bacterium]